MIKYIPYKNLDIVTINVDGEEIIFEKMKSYQVSKDSLAWMAKRGNDNLIFIERGKKIVLQLNLNNKSYNAVSYNNEEAVFKAIGLQKRNNFCAASEAKNIVKMIDKKILEEKMSKIDRSKAPIPLEIKLAYCYTDNFVSTYEIEEDVFLDMELLVAEATFVFNNTQTIYDVTVVIVGILKDNTIVDDSAGLGIFGGLYGLLTNVTSGKLPQVDEYKLLVEADLVVLCPKLWRGDGGTGGLAAVGGVADYNYCCIILAHGFDVEEGVFNPPIYTLDETVLVHEMGHLLGANHPLSEGEEPIEAPTYGHKIVDADGNTIAGTVMSYANNESVVKHFSDSRRYYPAPYETQTTGVLDISEAYKTVEANLENLAFSYENYISKKKK